MTLFAALVLCVALTDAATAQDGRASVVQPYDPSTRPIPPALGQYWTACMMALASGSCITATSRATCEAAVRGFEPLCLAQLPADSQRNLKTALEYETSGIPLSADISPTYDLLKAVRQRLFTLQSGSQPVNGSSR